MARPRDLARRPDGDDGDRPAGATAPPRLPQGLLPALARADEPQRIVLQCPYNAPKRRGDGRLRANPSQDHQGRLVGVGAAEERMGEDSRRAHCALPEPQHLRGPHLLDVPEGGNLFQGTRYGWMISPEARRPLSPSDASKKES